MKERQKLFFEIEKAIKEADTTAAFTLVLTRTLRDALALLKEREARVMTAEEVAHLKEEIYQWLWIEEKQKVTWNLHCLRAFVYSKHPDHPDTGDFYILANGYRDVVKLEGEEYGSEWRCWTSRPTPEQVRDTPWEEPDV